MSPVSLENMPERFMELGLQEDRKIRPIKNKAVTYIVFLPKLFKLLLTMSKPTDKNKQKSIFKRQKQPEKPARLKETENI